MNLDPLGPRDGQETLAPPEWTMDLQRDGVMYRGIVKRAYVEVCRIAVASEGLTEATARTALAHKARAWISDYLSRTT